MDKITSMMMPFMTGLGPVPLFIRQQKMINSPRTANDYFGKSVALDGAYCAMTASADPGAVIHIFHRVGSTWSLYKTLSLSCADLSMSGPSLAVGAPENVYIFLQSGSTWNQQAILKGSDSIAGDTFGQSVEIDANTCIVGAPTHDPSGLSNAGAAYVFTRSGTTWTQQQKLTASNKAAGDYFGRAVAVDADTCIVAAPQASSFAGKACLYFRSGSTWGSQGILPAPSGITGFGKAVDVDGDTCVVTGSEGTLGATYVYTRSGTTWSLQQKLTPADRADSDYFGWTVALKGDICIVGSHMNNNGAAYIFTRSGGVWTERQKFVGDSGNGDTWFTGYQGLDFDGVSCLVGAACERNGTGMLYAGSAYVFMM